MTNIKAVVFDADGTLFDSEDLIVKTYEHVAATHGYPAPTRAAIHAQLGKPIREMITVLFPGADAEELFLTNVDYFGRNAIYTAPYNGLREALEQISNSGVKLAVLTSGGDKIHDLLKHHKIAHLFTSVVHSERISKHKPDPEGFLLATKECMAEPGDCVVVGDMNYDILVGKYGAAMATVGLTHGYGSRESLETAGADYIIDSLAELPAVLGQIEKTCA